MVIQFISLLLTMVEMLFLFLKGMTGALAPFSYLVIAIKGLIVSERYFNKKLKRKT